MPEGCRVPRGFVVTSAAYRLHLLGETGEKLRLAVDADRRERDLEEGPGGDPRRETFPDEVRDAIKAAFDALGVEPLCGALVGDDRRRPLGSLAGLFDTYLGVSGLRRSRRSHPLGLGVAVERARAGGAVVDGSLPVAREPGGHRSGDDRDAIGGRLVLARSFGPA